MGSSPAVDKKGAKQEDRTFIQVAVLTFGISIVVLAVFSFLKDAWKRIYAPRVLYEDEDRTLAVPDPDQGTCSWMQFVWDPEDLIKYGGFDAMVHLRTIMMCLKIVLLCIPYCIVLIIVNVLDSTNESNESSKRKNAQEDVETSYVKMFSLTSSETDNLATWMSLFGAYIFTWIVMCVLHKTYEEMAGMAERYFSRMSLSAYTIFVVGLPEEFQDEDTLLEEFSQLFPDQVHSVTLVANSNNVFHYYGTIKMNQNQLRKIEEGTDCCLCNCDVDYHNRPYDFCYRKNCCEKNIDALRDGIVEAAELAAGAKQHLTYTDKAFVTFKTLDAAIKCANSRWRRGHDSCQTMTAPDPLDVAWENLKITRFHHNVLKATSMVMLVILMVFWVVPVGFLIGFANLEHIGEFLEKWFSYKYKDWLVVDLPKYYPWIEYMEGVAPEFILNLWVSVLPYLIYVIMFLRLDYQYSVRDASILRFNYFIVLTMVLFFVTLSASALKSLSVKDLPKRIVDIFNYMGSNLPTMAAFFINYVNFATLALSWTLLRWSRYCTVCCCSESDFMYWQYLSDNMVIFAICIVYSVISPLVLVFGALYFFYSYIVNAYLLLHVYQPRYETGFLTWPQIYDMFCWAVYLMQIFFTTTLILKAGYLHIPLLLILPLLTFIAQREAHKCFSMAFKTPTLSSGFETDLRRQNRDQIKNNELRTSGEEQRRRRQESFPPGVATHPYGFDKNAYILDCLKTDYQIIKAQYSEFEGTLLEMVQLAPHPSTRASIQRASSVEIHRNRSVELTQIPQNRTSS